MQKGYTEAQVKRTQHTHICLVAVFSFIFSRTFCEAIKNIQIAKWSDVKRQPAASSASTTITTALTAAITTKNNNRRNNNAQPHPQSVDQTICQASRSARGSQNICTKTIGKCLACGFVYWLSYCSVGRGGWRVESMACATIRSNSGMGTFLQATQFK